VELKINIAYSELLELIKQLPSTQLFQLKADLLTIPIKKEEKETQVEVKKNDFALFLLNGPVMSDEQSKNYEENKKWINQWKAKQ
jgi:hypothetical protein